MANYDFHTLNDKEFEIVVNSLISKEYNCRVERFKPGRDQGVDGRFFKTGDEIIIQSKHWLRTGVSKLLTHLEKKERVKVVKLNPQRYILATSLPLSRDNKKKIKELLSPYIHSERDILGQEDLNDLLVKFPNVETNNYKLWLSSANILKVILNSGVIGRSNFALEQIRIDSSKYVETVNHHKAIDKLNDNHSIIITGAPGIGKTTLANQLALYYVTQEFEFILIEDSIGEAESLYKDEVKQLFYFDDFLGRNFLLALELHQDSKIVNFIKRIGRDSNKRFILTTRTNIINQGKRLSDLFNINKIDKNEYELRIESLTKYDKAKILYNHIWFGNLKDHFIDELYNNKRYLEIIGHKNFNPRLISFITDAYRVSNITSTEYWSYIRRTLDNPKDIWNNVIEVQIDYECKQVIIGVVLHGRAISEANLNNFINNLRTGNSDFSIQKTNDTIIQLLTGALLNRNHGLNIEFDLFNPSIADYVLSAYLKDRYYISRILYFLGTEQSLYNLFSLLNSGLIDKLFYNECLLSTYKLSKTKESKILFSPWNITLVSLLIELSELPKEFLSDLQDNIEEFIQNKILIESDEYLSIIQFVLDHNLIKDRNLLKEKITKELKEEITYEECLSAISYIISSFNDNVALLDLLKSKVIQTLSESIEESVNDSEIYADIYDYEQINLDILIEFINDKLSEFEFKFDQDDINAIADYCSLDEVIQYNINTYGYEDEYIEELDRPSQVNNHDINDLFDRS